MKESVYDFSAKANDGSELSFSQFKGRPILIVNTASKCGFTPQYKGLQKLYEDYGNRGFEVIGFPCDQFAHQEPDGDAAIQNFCERNFGVTFPLMSKIEVNGACAHPLFAWLKKKAPGFLGARIKWNFTKFLVASDGKTVRRYAPAVEPATIAADIERALGQ
jgi:glutathione peroxidase